MIYWCVTTAYDREGEERQHLSQYEADTPAAAAEAVADIWAPMQSDTSIACIHVFSQPPEKLLMARRSTWEVKR